MNYEEVFQSLQEVERSLDVNAYWLDGVQVWPLIRRDLWMHLLKTSEQQIAEPAGFAIQPAEKGSRRRQPARGEDRKLSARKSGRNGAKELRLADVLFLSRMEDHTEVFADGVLDRMIDPMLWHAQHEGLATLKLSVANGDDRNRRRQIERSVFVSLERGRRHYGPSQPSAELEEFLRGVEKIAGAHPITAASVLSAVRRLSDRAELFDVMLDMVQPRLVMLAVFYSPDALALIHACRRRWIPVVDIQHGKQGLYHAMYGGWSALPADGYSVLPDFFWTWGVESAEVIESTLPAGAYRPRPVVGGNRWLALWKSGAGLRCPPAADALLGRMSGFDRRILVSLQPIAEPLPEPLLAAMRHAPDGWLWLVRPHPHQRRQIPEIEARLASEGIRSYDVAAASHAPLYPVLANVDAHVTCWSSVAYESVAFGKPSVFVHPVARKLYPHHIAKGLFSYAETGEALLEALSAGPEAAGQTDGLPYIETSDDTARQALEYCLEAGDGIARLAATARIGDLSARLEAKVAESRELAARLESAEDERLAIAAKLTGTEAERREFGAILEAAEAGEGSLAAQLATARANERDLAARLESAEAERRDLAATLESAEAERRDLAARLESMESERREFAARLEAAQAEQRAFAARLQAAQAEGREIAGKLKAAQAKGRDLAAKLKSANAELAAVKDSMSWRLTAPLRSASRSAPWLAGKGRQAVKLLSWAGTGWIGDRRARLDSGTGRVPSADASLRKGLK